MTPSMILLTIGIYVGIGLIFFVCSPIFRDLLKFANPADEVITSILYPITTCVLFCLLLNKLRLRFLNYLESKSTRPRVSSSITNREVNFRTMNCKECGQIIDPDLMDFGLITPHKEAITRPISGPPR
jgi:hypothetical protein